MPNSRKENCCFRQLRSQINNKPKEISVSEFEKQCVLFAYDLGKGTVRKRFKDADLKKLYDAYPEDCEQHLKDQLNAYLEKKKKKSNETE